MHTATTQKAAWDGSPGTSSSNGAGRDGTRRTTWVPSPCSVSVTRTPQRARSSSVWRRVSTGSRTTVSPSAPKPARSTHDFTWALAMGVV